MKSKRLYRVDNDLVDRYFPVNHMDGYEITYTSEKELSPGEIMLAFWTVKPRWVESLFSFRNILMKPFGLKGDQPNQGNVFQECILQGEDTGFISLSDRSEREIVLKLNDSHLCAWLAVITDQTGGNTYRVKLITLVRYHNLLGRIYFVVILPFHHLIVRCMLKFVVKYLLNEKGDRRN